jgi:hypothetical protein
MRRHLLPQLRGGAPDGARSGAVAALGTLVAALGLQLVPFVNLIVVPLMGLTSDPLPAVRAAATAAFAASVALLPLAQVLAGSCCCCHMMMRRPKAVPQLPLVKAVERSPA